MKIIKLLKNQIMVITICLAVFFLGFDVMASESTVPVSLLRHPQCFYTNEHVYATYTEDADGGRTYYCVYSCGSFKKVAPAIGATNPQKIPTENNSPVEQPKDEAEEIKKVVEDTGESAKKDTEKTSGVIVPQKEVVSAPTPVKETSTQPIQNESKTQNNVAENSRPQFVDTSVIKNTNDNYIIITGTIKDSDNNPLTNTVVEISDGHTFEKKTKTDKHGVYSVIAAGTDNTVTVTAKDADGNVLAKETVHIEDELVPLAGINNIPVDSDVKGCVKNLVVEPSFVQSVKLIEDDNFFDETIEEKNKIIDAHIIVLLIILIVLLILLGVILYIRSKLTDKELGDKNEGNYISEQ